MQTARQIRWFFAGWLCLQSCLAANPTGTIHLIVNCETPGARVYLERHALGRAGEELAVPYGRDLHLTVRAPRHISETLLLPCLLPGDPVLEIPVDLAPEPAALRITAESPNRMTKISRGCLLLDGQDLGEVYLPFETNDLAPGVHTISLSVHGFKNPCLQKVELEPGQRAAAVMALAYDDAYLVFNLFPTNAVVHVAGEAARDGEGVYRVVPNRFYDIRITATGHHGARFEAAAMPGERRLLNVRLTPRTFLLFELTPDHAAIFTKGRRISGRLLEVNGGETYRIEIRATGYEPHALVVTPEPGEHRVIHVDLKKKGFW